MAVSGLAVTFALRTAAAAWTVFPSPLVRMPAPTGDLAAVQRAAALAPGEASYAAYEAELLAAAARTIGTGPEALVRAEQAWQAAERAIALQPTNPGHRLLSGHLAVTRALLPGASPADRDEWLERGRVRLNEARARNAYSPALNQQVGVELLRAWDGLGEPGQADAMAALQRAAALDGAVLTNNLRTMIGRLGPVGAIDRLPALTPDETTAWQRAASVLEREARVRTVIDPDNAARLNEAALDAYRRAVIAGDLETNALQQWIDAWRRLAPSETDRFLAEAETLQAAHPGRPEPWLALATARERLEDPEAAELAFDRAVETARELPLPGPDSRERPLIALALERRGDFHYRARDWEASAADYEEVTVLEPGNGGAWIRRGRSLDALELRDEALQVYLQAARRNPRNAGLRSILADAYVARREWLKGITEYRTVIALQPQNNAARLQIARAYRDLGIVDQSIRWYREVLDRDADNAAARREMTRLLQDTGR